ncbi:MAG TPA: serine/threonine-protein kinase [Polyangiaceae bacterium]
MTTANVEPKLPELSEEAARTCEARSRVGITLRGKWHLNELIAVGGMGAVYDATHRNGMRGAVKILDPLLSQSGPARSRFLREGRLANRVHHPGAVQVLDDDEAEDGSAYLVMELLTGSTLDALAQAAGGKLEASKAIEYGLQVVDTLAEAHASGIVHRDIKPENLFLTNDGVVKVLDFGIAGTLVGDGSATLTRSGELIGTPAFMAPEQARGRWELVDHQSDLYSLGAALFFLLTGRLVQGDHGTVAEMLVRTITQSPPSLGDVMPDAPEALVRAIDGALKLQKSERWESAAAMRVALADGYLALTGNDAPAPAPRSQPEIDVTALGPSRVRRLMLQTTLRLRSLPGKRWFVSAAIAAVACVTLVSVLAVAATNHDASPAPVAATPAAVAASLLSPPASSLDPQLPAANPEPSAAVSAPVTVVRYQPLYDRRH